MGKKNTISSLSKIIANITVHKILLKYTNKPESVSHLNYETTEYRNTAISRAEEFNWNKQDKERIRLGALKHFKRKMEGGYRDVEFPIRDAIRLLDETLRGVGVVG